MVRRCSKKRYVGPRAMTAARQARRGEPGRGVEGEGEQIERNEDAGGVFLAMPEIVSEVISFGLENVKGPRFRSSSGAAAGSEFGDGIWR